MNPKIINSQQKLSVYQKLLGQLEFEDFDFPMAVRDLPHFEKINNTSVNIFCLEINQITPLYLSKSPFETINLLLFTDGVIFHYCPNTNFNVFKTRQFEKVPTEKQNACVAFMALGQKELLFDHSTLCGEHDAVSIKMSPNGSKFRLQIWHKLSLNPYVIYADTESICTKHSGCKPHLAKKQ